MKKTTRLFAALTASAVMAASLSGCGKSKENVDGNGPSRAEVVSQGGNEGKGDPGELNIYTWAEYVPQDVIDQFEDETGIRVNYTNFEANEEMLAKLETSKGGDYDIIIASDYIIKIAADEGLVKELDKEQLPNFKNIDPVFQNFFYDPENKYTVPYGPGIPLLVYDPSVVTCEITGYGSLWDPSLEDSLALMDSERVVMGIKNHGRIL